MYRRDHKAEREQHRIEVFCCCVFIAFMLVAAGYVIYALTGGWDDNYGNNATIIVSNPPADSTDVLFTEFPEDPNEQDNIYAALLEIGYLRDDVPLSYELQDALRTACDVYGVEYCLMLGMIQYESNFDETCVSSTGCYGLMQLNPKYFPSGLDSVDNIMYGVEFFAKCLENNNYNVPSALRAYNRGYDDGHRVYANKVLEYANKWREGEKYAAG